MKKLSLFLVFLVMVLFANAQIYHEEDKEGLRIFLAQPSAQAGKTNGEQLGLTSNDILTWNDNENWVFKVKSLEWNNDTPKRLIIAGYGSVSDPSNWAFKKLAGELDASKWEKLTILVCDGNSLTGLNVKTNEELIQLSCGKNLFTSLDVQGTNLETLGCGCPGLTELDLSGCANLQALNCVNSSLTSLNLSGCTNLTNLGFTNNLLTNLDLDEGVILEFIFCENNRLQLSTLYDLSLRVKNNMLKFLGNQILEIQTVEIGEEIDFSDQTKFGGVQTVFNVTKNGYNAVINVDYEINNGIITFNNSGSFMVSMTNSAIVSPYSPAVVIAQFGVNEDYVTQIYHQEDKEGLRIFLAQPSAEPGKTNGEQLGLTSNDMLTWYDNENWVPKVISIQWSDDYPKRILTAGVNSYIVNYKNWTFKALAGELDASKWEKLTGLECSGNLITGLNVSSNPNLNSLYCSLNKLTSLDVSGCPDLWSISCGNNYLTELDVSACTNLALLFCGDNLLTEVNIKGCNNLQNISFSNNNFSYLDLSAHTSLRQINCFQNRLQLSTLFEYSEMVKNKDKGEFGTQNLPMKIVKTGEDIDFSNQAVLGGVTTVFTVKKNNGNAIIDVDYNISGGIITFLTQGFYEVTMKNSAIISNGFFPVQVIAEFDCIDNDEEGIFNENDKEGLRLFLSQPSAEEGKTNGEQLGLTAEDMANWYESEYWVSKLSFNSNILTWNDATPKRLVQIHISVELNLAGELDASKWEKLTQLYCYYTQINSLNLRSNFELKNLLFGRNMISELDVSSNSELEILSCINNSLTALDVSSNTKLKSLNCGSNLITELDLSSNIALTGLACYDNKLTELDISSNYALNLLECHNNSLQLSTLYSFSEKINSIYDKRLGEQFLPVKTVGTGEEIDFSAQAVLGGVETVFVVKKNGVNAVIGTDYTISNGIITFLLLDNYTVTMTNSAITSHNDYPVQVIAEFECSRGENLVGISDANQQTLSVYVQNGILHVSGLIPGEKWSVYAVSGNLIAEGISVDSHCTTHLLSKGVYIFRSGDRAVKVVY